MKRQKIRTKATIGRGGFSGELNGTKSYLLVTDEAGRGVACLEGQPLYRLARAIVDRFEHDRTIRELRQRFTDSQPAFLATV